ncbi:MAG: hypothetical protein KatS3mg058_0725 [Roseiflexus sp.]|nr:MAG: hypothetical protein KatS3mg058_0725 [Roseiflexus sp.]
MQYQIVQGVARPDIQLNTDIAELQPHVGERDAGVRHLAQRNRQIGGDGRGANATFRRHDNHQPPCLPITCRGGANGAITFRCYHRTDAVHDVSMVNRTTDDITRTGHHQSPQRGHICRWSDSNAVRGRNMGEDLPDRRFNLIDVTIYND